MRRRKYGSKKVKYDGLVFDSKKEMHRYIELKHLERIGVITDLKLQEPFELVPAQREPSTFTKRGTEKKGKVIEKSIKYVADFVYMQNGELVVEDTKGVRTTDYIIKRKLMLYLRGIRIREI